MKSILLGPFVLTCIVVTTLSMFLVSQGTVYYPLIALASLLTCFVVTRFFGWVPGVLVAMTSLTFLSATGYFGALLTATETARFTEVIILTFGAILCASLLRLSESKFARLQQERASLSDALVAVEQRQRWFVRDVLASVTDHRLFLCDSMDDLPVPIARCDSQMPLRLTSAALFCVRARIRKAGSDAGLRDSMIGELVIAGSEAALNAVVHG
ncbi:MAG: hypothetical protein H7145_12335 [Akkermansiaceae bacterium]|nr:hypothetical protein [Armatimonadota bacterium]